MIVRKGYKVRLYTPIEQVGSVVFARAIISYESLFDLFDSQSYFAPRSDIVVLTNPVDILKPQYAVSSPYRRLQSVVIHVPDTGQEGPYSLALENETDSVVFAVREYLQNDSIELYRSNWPNVLT